MRHGQDGTARDVRGRLLFLGCSRVYEGCRRSLTSRLPFFFGALLLSLFVLTAIAGCRPSKPVGGAADGGDGAAADGGDGGAARPHATVAVLGCAVLRKRAVDVVCETSGPLRVVADAPIDGVDAGPSKADGLYTYVVVPDRPRLTLAVGQTLVTDLVLEPHQDAAWLLTTRELRAAGKFKEADAVAAVADGQDSEERARRLSQLGRNALAQEKIEPASASLTDAMKSHAHDGRISEAVDDAYALAYAATEHGAYDRARAAIEEVHALVPLYAEAHAREPYYLGVVASDMGDLRSAVRLFAEAARKATHYGMKRLAEDAATSHALTLARLGRAEEAEALLTSTGQAFEGEHGCRRMEFESNVAFALLERPKPNLEAALAHASAAEREDCGYPGPRATALANLASAQLRAGDFPAAEASTAKMATLRTGRLTDRLFLLELKGRIALGKATPKTALRLFEEQCALAEVSAASEEGWRCELGRGDALQALGKSDEAIGAYRRAEDALDRWAVSAPVGEGRTSFLADRDQSHRELVDLLVGAGKLEDALNEVSRAFARSARALRWQDVFTRARGAEREAFEKSVGAFHRARAQVDELSRADWTLSATALAKKAAVQRERILEAHRSFDAAISLVKGEVAPRPKDAVVHPPEDALLVGLLRGHSEFLLTASRGGQTRVERLAQLGGASAALDAWLASLRELLRAAHRVLIWSEVESVDLHATLVDGKPLGTLLPVEYLFGFGPQTGRAGVGSALVVGDPRQNLPGAKTETLAVESALRSRGFSLVSLGDKPRSGVVSLLSGADLFHYAGHGLFVDSEDGLETGLDLGLGRLTVADVLSLRRVPEIVVLSACETARSDSERKIAGLAHAFLSAGSQSVIAPTRRVSDEISREFVAALYESWPASGSLVGVSEAARHASQKVSGTRGISDWSAYRVLSAGW